MSFIETLILGTVAGFTIFLGLPLEIGRASCRERVSSEV